MRNARVIYDGLKEVGYEVYGGINAPYISGWRFRRYDFLGILLITC